VTLGEAIRQVWPTMQRVPLPATVADVKAMRDSGFGCSLPGDRYRVTVAFWGNRIDARLMDHEALKAWEIEDGLVEGGTYTAREFLDLIAQPDQPTPFEAAS
jgi:hypothetical protein